MAVKVLRDRIYTLDFGSPYSPSYPAQARPDVYVPMSNVEASTPYIQESVADQAERAFLGEGQGRRVTELNISFEIVKVLKDSETSKIKIYNLSDESVGILENNSGLKTFIRLQAGYRGSGQEEIFKGVVEEVEDLWVGETRETSLTVSDDTGARWALSSAYFPPGTPARVILQELIRDTGMSLNVMDGVPVARTITKPLYLVGRTQEQMEQFARAFKLDISYYDLSINVSASGVSTPEAANSALVLGPQTGLIGNVTFVDNNGKSSPTEANSATKGIKFQHLLRADLAPHRMIKVETHNIKGIYKITNVTHKGEYRGNDWFTEVEAEASNIKEVE